MPPRRSGADQDALGMGAGASRAERCNAQRWSTAIPHGDLEAAAATETLYAARAGGKARRKSGGDHSWGPRYRAVGAGLRRATACVASWGQSCIVIAVRLCLHEKEAEDLVRKPAKTSTLYARLRRLILALCALLMMLTIFLQDFRSHEPLRLEIVPPETCAHFAPIELAKRQADVRAEDVKPRIAIATILQDIEPEARQASLQNKQEYAKRHGYDLIVADDVVDRSRALEWSKLLAVERHLPNYDYVLYASPSAIIMNMDLRIEDILDPWHSIFLSRDQNGLNTAVMLIRNEPWVFQFIRQVWGQTWVLTAREILQDEERRALQFLYGSISMNQVADRNGFLRNPEAHVVRERVKPVDSCALSENACKAISVGADYFWGACKQATYAEGNFIVHFDDRHVEADRTRLTLQAAAMAEQRNRLP
ncbi:Galactomannan galactosyltransferase 1 [Hondaea fermentalgiana]|uniref:Galactomannan galactosyltransferase 1 n=1 Tax=Hondaea fermentalgiana TaxID=2315210 RepID=A0A2R5G171_9STRA|nr:Galactomannan galactosyltransferase 1 [Hondaea fermentalgiana]|eukprot:GBG24742.1 Galactomannan galactosyltransferase 1 [Hondaea fermentalgiana]